MSEMENYGILYIVATPIGNLKDITLRALDVLQTVDWVAAEDTRHSKKLLQHYAIQKPLISLHDHNELEKRNELLEKLQSGQNGALISDAGTPLISDPGYHLVSLLRSEGVRVEPIPGASALITALSAAGIPTNRFTFEGFLAAKTHKKQQQLTLLNDETRTMVFYESPHRLMDTLKALKDVFGKDRDMVVAKELTKQFEAFVSGSINEVCHFFEDNQDKIRGEFVLMLAGKEKDSVIEVEEADGLIKVLLQNHISVKQTSEIVAGYFGLKKKAIYSRALFLIESD